MTPLIEQLLKLEGGCELDMLMPLPPLLILRGKECSDNAHKIEGDDAFEDEGPKENGFGAGETRFIELTDLRAPNAGAKGDAGQQLREALVLAVTMYPSMNVTLDGGTWASASSVSVAAKDLNNFLSSQTREEHSQPYCWDFLDANDTVRAWCERKRPGNASFLAVALAGLNPEQRVALNRMTRPQRRIPRPRPAQPGRAVPEGVYSGDGEQQAAAAASRAAAAAAAHADSSSDVDMMWARDALNTMVPPFDPNTYVCEVQTTVGMEGDGRYGIEIPLRDRTLLRLPCLPEKVGQRALPDAAWGDMPVIVRSALCILHAGMRTSEALFTRVLGANLANYATRSNVKRAFDEHLNTALGKLGVKKIWKNIETGATGAVSFDGPAVQSWIGDLHAGLVATQPDLQTAWGLKKSESRFLRGLARALEQLGAVGDYNELLRCLPMLTDYAIGMTSALQMRPTERDYDLVDKHLPRYVVGKLVLWEGSNTWYDNHMLYAVPHMMRQWGSLRLVSQEVRPHPSWTHRCASASAPARTHRCASAPAPARTHRCASAPAPAPAAPALPPTADSLCRAWRHGRKS